MYRAIDVFFDLQDSNHKYLVGDTFPHEGLIVSKERISELTGVNNKLGRPLIEMVEEGKNEPEKAYTKTEITRMNKADAITLAYKLGIANVDEMSLADLKQAIVHTLNM